MLRRCCDHGLAQMGWTSWITREFKPGIFCMNCTKIFCYLFCQCIYIRTLSLAVHKSEVILDRETLICQCLTHQLLIDIQKKLELNLLYIVMQFSFLYFFKPQLPSIQYNSFHYYHDIFHVVHSNIICHW